MNTMKAGIVFFLVIIIGGAYFASTLIDKAQVDADRLLQVVIPKEQAVREVEVSVWETSNAIYYYMVEPSGTSLQEYKKQLKDVDEYMAKYKSLIDDKKEKDIAARFEQIWFDTVSKAEELIRLRDQLTKLQEKTWDSVHDVDDVVDYKIQVTFIEEVPDRIEKEKAIREVEVSLWEANNAVNYYIHRQFEKPKRELFRQVDDVDKFWAKFKKLDTMPLEKLYLEEFESKWSRSAEEMKQCLTLADEMKSKYLEFWELLHAADDIIDFEIQDYLALEIMDFQK